jgi:kanamycin kinase/aminoglycoside 3'-phosphotransferase-2
MNPTLPEALEHHLEGFSFNRVTVGQSGAGVWRLSRTPSSTQSFDLEKTLSGTVFLKIATVSSDPDHGFSLRSEAGKLEWMRSRGVNVPTVEQFLEHDGFEYLLTRALPGRDASNDWPKDEVPRVVDALADGLCLLHSLEVAGCSFDARLEVKIAQARERVEYGLIDLDDLDEERLGRSAESLLEELLGRNSSSEYLVFCHGDYCVPNVILDGSSVGFVDVGRAGIADRWQDLSLMTRSLESDMNPQFNGFSRRFLERYGVSEPDLEKITFYRLLDEFF